MCLGKEKKTIEQKKLNKKVFFKKKKIQDGSNFFCEMG